MKIGRIVSVGLVLLLGGTLSASAQMMGGGGGMGGVMEMMGGGMHEAGGATACPGMGTQPTAFGFEGPWISLALAHAKEIELTPDQVKGLTGLRDEFQKEAVRLIAEIRGVEVELRRLYRQKPVDLQAVEAKVRAIAGLEGDLRLGRLTTLEKGNGFLTPEQQRKLGAIARSLGPMPGASMMGGPPEFTR